MIPTLILQPVVENAVLHGVGSRSGPALIVIRAGREKGRLRLVVSNDSPAGESAGVVSRGLGIGLKNSRERLDRLYGDAYRFDLSEPGDGQTVVELIIPLQLESETAKSSESLNKSHFSPHRR